MKQGKICISVGTLFCVCTLLLSFMFQNLLNTLDPETVDADARELPVIILDAGHGGEDGGATGTNGVLEKDLNLSLTQALAELLRMAGYTVIETRTVDRLLYDAGTKKGHKKQGDLQNRLKFTEQYPNSVLISIHMNTFPAPDCTGTQVWYSQNDPASLEWANAVQSTVRTVLQTTNNRKVKAATSGIYILRHAKTPAILIECGFLSTPAECERLSDPDYRRALAFTLFTAIAAKMQSSTCM
ncbi:MAG: N-acetylmuramoyl-L-alanine amidase [Clostridia bacterium]|nr:N-acetylmuramoyl-L-alanine amidase [Clostridia bacterium]